MSTEERLRFQRPFTYYPAFVRPCRFFHALGYCERGSRCEFSHDNHGRGSGFREGGRSQGWNQTAAIWQGHVQDKGKMLPVCYRFAQGRCFDENCPYPHVKVNPRAPVCEPFLDGYCPRGSACRLLHTYECQAWVHTGECNDMKCRFKHPQNVRGLHLPPSNTVSSSSSAGPSKHRIGTLAASDGDDTHNMNGRENSLQNAHQHSRSQQLMGDRARLTPSEEDGTVTDYNDNRAKRRKIARLPDLLSGPTIPKFCSTQR